MAADFVWNWNKKGVPMGTRVFAELMDFPYKPVYSAVLVQDKASWETQLEKVLAWEAEILIPCHGDIIEGKGKVRSFLMNFF